MRKLKENKGMSLIVFTVILAVLVVMAGGVIVYLLNNPKTLGIQVQNPTNVASYNSSDIPKEDANNIEKETKVSNKSDTSTGTDIVTSLAIKNNPFEGELKIYRYLKDINTKESIELSYIIGNKNLTINYGDKNKKEIKVKKDIIDIITCQCEDYLENKNIYFLYNDGTVGKINTKDIANKKYEISEIKGVSNIVRIQELMGERNSTSGSHCIVAIDQNGKAQILEEIVL